MPLLDTLAEEIQFVDHLAPIWKALPETSRGLFMVHPAYIAYARGLGIEATVRNHASTNPVLVASFGDMKTAQAMGRTQIARIEHGCGQSYGGIPDHGIAHHASYAGGDGAGVVGLFLVPNEHSARRWREAYPQSRVEIVGSPKLDVLPPFDPPIGEPIIGVSTHWDWYWDGAPELISAWSTYSNAIVALAKTHRVLGHAHPKAAPMVSRWFAKKDIAYAEHFEEIVAKAAVFVCDNSSAIFEFAATGRPVVVLNIPQYRRSVIHGLRFDWSTVTNVGVNCNRPEDLPAAIDEALADAPERRSAREAALDVVYAYRSGASLRGAAALIDWMATLSTRQPVRVGAATTAADRVDAFRASL